MFTTLLVVLALLVAVFAIQHVTAPPESATPRSAAATRRAPTNRAAVLLRKVHGRLIAVIGGRHYLSGATFGDRFAGFNPFAVLRAFCAVALPVLAVALLVAFLPFNASALGFLPVMGSTTGTTTGTDFNGLADMLKNVYTKAFENNVENESEISDLIEQAEGFEVVEGPDGNGIYLDHIFSSGGGVGSIKEDDYLPTPTPPTSKQSIITIPIHAAVVELSGKTLRRVKKGPAAFATWADRALPAKAGRLAYHMDRQRLGTGTGIMFRMNGTPDGTGDGIDNMFGISGLDDRAAMLVLRDDTLRYGPNANGTSLRAGVVKVAAVHYDAKTLDTTVAGSTATATSAADNDYVFLGDANVNGSGTREMIGLEAIVDDGTNVATFQTLTRSSYPELNSQIVDASAASWGGELTEEILDYADSLAFERGNMGRPSFVLVNRSAQRSYWKQLKNDRVINDPRGAFTGGVNKQRLKMILGDRTVTLAAGRKVPASRAYGIDGSAVMRYKVGGGRWDDTDGSIWNRVVDGTGRKDAFFAVYILEEQQGASNPAGCFKLTNLTEN